MHARATGVASVEFRRMLREAHEDGEEAAALVFSQARDVEEFHAKLYKRVLDHLIWERETTYYICTVCGRARARHIEAYGKGCARGRSRSRPSVEIF